MLSLSRLQVLCEVVSRGSFSGAAEALSYTQSAISQSVAGATLVAHAETIFASVEAAEAEFAAVLGVRSGRLRVASFPSAGATLMPLAVARFRQAHPDVELTLAAGGPEQMGPRLRA